MIIKCGRNEWQATVEDLVMFNGSCYQVISRKNPSWCTHINIIMAKARAEKMIKDGDMILTKEHLTDDNLKYYRFNTTQKPTIPNF
jgi:hypothetical protein